MCQISISDESFQNHHYLAGNRVTVKLALRAGPLGQLFELAMNNAKPQIEFFVRNYSSNTNIFNMKLGKA
jgi:hypothetical protein